MKTHVTSTLASLGMFILRISITYPSTAVGPRAGVSQARTGLEDNLAITGDCDALCSRDVGIVKTE